MRVIGRELLDSFCKEHADCRKWVANWLADAQHATWADSHAIRMSYASASFLPDNVVIFNVRGNDYRMETQVAYRVGVIAVKWIGTHAEYTRRYR
jgi:mRNA interferase HigB